MEIAPGEHRVIVGEDQWIVGARVEFDRQHAAQVVDRVVAGAMHLGGAAQRIGVLHPVAEHVRLGDPAAFGQGEDAGGRRDLAGMRPHAVDAGIEGGARATQGLHAERRHHVGGQEESLRIVQHQAGGTSHEMGAVEHAERVLRLQRNGLEAGGLERIGARPPLAFPEHLSLADQHQADVRGWREIAAGAQGTLLGHQRIDVVVEEVDQPFGHHEADAGGALAELVDADKHPGAHQFFWKWRTNADRVAHQQVALQLAGVGRRDPDVLERANPGGQSIDHPILGNQPVNQVTRPLQPGSGPRPEADPLALARHGHHIGGAQRLAVKRD